MSLSMVFAAPMVCRVESTRWPVSAAVMAMDIDSRSRISPTRMMSGSSRRADFKARAYEALSEPISLWSIMHLSGGIIYSIGSSQVITW